jgi:hypothetical protein
MSHGPATATAAAENTRHTPQVVKISSAGERQAYQRMYENKVVLIFEIQLSAWQVQDLLIYYNH